MSFITEVLRNRKRAAEKGNKRFSKDDRVTLRENLESLRPDSHAYSDDGGKCWHCGNPKAQHKTCVVVDDGVREVRRVA